MVEIQGVEYLTSQQVADQCGVTRQTVYEWIKADLLGDVKDLGPRARTRYLIPATSLEGFEPPSSGGRGWPAGRKRSGDS